MEGFLVGVLGGGQLGRMLGFAAGRLGIKLVCLDPMGDEAPASACVQVVQGSFGDAADVKGFAEQVFQTNKGKQVLTVEIEHVSIEALRFVEENMPHVHVVPSSACLDTIRNKFVQKQVFSQHGLGVAEFAEVESEADLKEMGRKWEYPMMLKTKFCGYDGKGNCLVKSAADVSRAFQGLGGKDLYVERFSAFKAELAVMVARSITGELKTFSLVETVQKDHVCDIVFAPPSFQLSAREHAVALETACKAVSAVQGFGIFGVELFLLADGSVLVNEIAPRPHNSGHYSLDGCETDQFEQHLRAVLGLKLGECGMLVEHSAMVNLLGGVEYGSLLERALGMKGVHLHEYGKKENRTGRKMGHVNIIADSHRQLLERIRELRGEVSETGKESESFVKVGIIMGSDSDLPTMKECAEVLSEFGVSFELTVVSAHRTPERLFQYSQTAVSRGLKVIIAGAGGAAHLPGMVAALTTLPVVGVPVKTSTLSGYDSLLSIVQMPRGVPVATVAIGNSKNAGLLAIRMLAMQDGDLQRKLAEFHDSQRDEVLEKAERLEKVGFETYLGSM